MAWNAPSEKHVADVRLEVVMPEDESLSDAMKRLVTELEPTVEAALGLRGYERVRFSSRGVRPRYHGEEL